MDRQDKKYNSGWPGLSHLRATLDDWKNYQRQTGEWPWRSIVFYFLHLVIEAAALFLFMWYSPRQRGWSVLTCVVVIFLFFLIDDLVWDWLQKRIRLSEIARHEHTRGL
jgi:NADH:ubiquinone oxidoreductase subunit 3 (subunit A)